jgi:DNA-directed RNA polymerase subunit alpha
MSRTRNPDEISALIEKGELDRAENLIQGPDDNASLLVLKGRIRRQQGRLDEAYAALEKAMQLDDQNMQAKFELAYTLDLHGEDERALELYESCIQQPPLHVNALMNLAVLYEDDGDFDNAERCLEQVLHQYPNHKRAQLFLQDVQSCKDMYYDEDQERDREKRNAVLDIPISDFELSVRSRNCLKKMNINTLGDLLHTTETELLAYKNFGETSLNEIKAMLTQKGLRLGQALDDKGPRAAPAHAQPADPTILHKPVSELEFSVRSRKCLHRLGIVTLGDLADRTEGELLASKNFGQTSLEEVKSRLTDYGLSLRPGEARIRH